jgi:hypothetical protein
MKNDRDVFPVWAADTKFAPRKIDDTGRHLTLTLEDDRAFKERGYNPYETIVHVWDTRSRDVWRNKPKRS